MCECVHPSRVVDKAFKLVLYCINFLFNAYSDLALKLVVSRTFYALAGIQTLAFNID